MYFKKTNVSQAVLSWLRVLGTWQEACNPSVPGCNLFIPPHFSFSGKLKKPTHNPSSIQSEQNHPSLNQDSLVAIIRSLCAHILFNQPSTLPIFPRNYQKQGYMHRRIYYVALSIGKLQI